MTGKLIDLVQYKLLTHAYGTGSQLALQGKSLQPKMNIGFAES